MKKLVLCALLFVAVVMYAEAPAGYYAAAEGKTNTTLRTALAGVIDGHKVVSYDNLKELYKYSDTKENDNDTRNMLIDIYSKCTYTPGSGYCGSKECGGGYNREHSVPKSWFNEASPMYSDAFHLYPTSCYVNSYRGNYALGECSGGSKCTTNGMTGALGRRGSCTYPGYSAVVYEPDDKYKGDLARTYFYMATRYADQCSKWSGGMFGSDNNGFKTWAINMLLEWHRADPVSEKEKIRNEAIFGNKKYNTGAYSQGNRNPFIDHPELAEYIWGNKKGEAWYSGETPIRTVTFRELAIYPNPATDFVTITTEVPEMHYAIVSLSGQVLSQGTVASGEALSLGDLANGMYLIRLQADDKTHVAKIVVNK